jgi:subtilase family serine protease
MGLRRPVVLGVATAVAVALPLAAVGARASGGAPPAPAVAGLSPLLVQGGRDLGPSPARTVQVTLTLPQRDQAGLQALIARQRTPGSADYRRFLTPAQFASRFSPTAASVATVTTWATSQNLAVTSVSANRTLVTVSGASAAMSRAFGVSFHDFLTPQGLRYFSGTGNAALPTALAGQVKAVLGLSNLGRVATLHPKARPAAKGRGLSTVTGLAGLSGLSGLVPAAASVPASYGPQDLWAFYNAPAAQTGQGQTLAILAEGNLAQPKADLVTFEQTFHLPAVQWTTIPVGAPSSDVSGNDEWSLDTQYSTGFAPGVSSLLVYDASSLNDGDILAAINKFVTDNRAKQMSFSAGECELLAMQSGFEASADQALAQAVSQGQTLFAASGDTGSFCPAPLVSVNGVPLGLPGQGYPANSPYAVSVGGTTILGLAPPLSEIAWIAGGGGISLTEPVPAYQAGAGGSFLPVQRGVPDVALDADPLTGYIVVVNGAQLTIGGTSASSPSWLGIWTRAQGAHGGNLGFANNVIYGEPASAFNDIVIGTNVPYVATPGWDYTTGRGTPNITAFVAAA